MKKIRFSTPILTPLLSNQPLCRAIAGASAVHLSLTALGLPSWPCPLRYGLGVPCPGCGLTRAIKSLAVGHWQQAMTVHAFAPLALIVVMSVGYASLAPVNHRRWIVRHCLQVERKTSLSFILTTLFLAYWLIRLSFFREAFYYLVL
ncbi:DUF2752 domain-containing protein [Altericista sp. CCNU0014]|uniref:DUF2752 domain-containing protein n=1 Tax=Altericista sp. CCNU0014 TaxID=3082949 RepID=UPI003850DAA6